MPTAATAKPAASPSRPLEFVVQKHDATRLHYDVRLEIDGAMMSWAVPKGPSFDPAVKRLAVETEDHPMEYNRFEGRIPDGEYGQGDVLIWDRGTYETVPPGQQAAMRKKGHLHVRLFGEKLVGDWHLVRTAGRGPAQSRAGATKTPWLFFKANDAHADRGLDIVAARPESVESGRRATRGPRRRSASPAAKDVAALLKTVGSPMRAVAVRGIARPDDFLYEVKFDGYRLLGAVAGGDARLVTRKGNDWTHAFAPVAEALSRLPVREAVVDGEACVVDDQGRSSFQRLQGWLGGAGAQGTLIFAAFDLLWLDGRDLRALAIEERRELLEALLKGAPPPLAFSPSLDGPLEELVAGGRRAGLEGLVAKRKGSSYEAARSGAWWKLKFRKEQEVALAGYVPRTDAPDEVGALIIAVRGKGGGFELAGKVGTGFDRATRKKLARLLDADRSDVPTVEGRPRIPGARWAKVRRVAQIELGEWTKDGMARSPSFLGLRDDKDPSGCVRERELPATATAAAKAAAPRPRPTEKPSASPAAKLSRPSKVLFPRDGITKADVAAYYAAIAPVMLPHLAGRPIGVQRWPNGIGESAWFQQNAPDKVPDFVRTIDSGPRHEHRRKVVVDNVETLGWLANLAALTIHQWASHVPAGVATPAAIAKSLGQADYTVLDLDPGEGTWAELVKVAQTLRGLLERLKLASYVKTSGQRGLHIIVPFAAGRTHEDATDFGRKLAAAVAAALPDIATVERMKNNRRGRLYIDALQNGEGKTIVAPYTIRAQDGAPVSMPIAWDEVTERLDPHAFTIRTALERVGKRGDLFAPVLSASQAMPAVAVSRTVGRADADVDQGRSGSPTRRHASMRAPRNSARSPRPPARVGRSAC